MMTPAQTEIFKTLVKQGIEQGLITPPDDPPVVLAKKRYPRNTPRLRGANLGVVEKDGDRYVIEYRPPGRLVVRKFYHHVRHELSLLDLVDIAQGQHLISTHKKRGQRPQQFQRTPVASKP